MADKSTSWRIPPETIADSEIAQHFQTDVAVIGLGYAGTSAARAAAEAGAGVIALEAMSEDKFNVLGEQFGHINSKYLANHGVPKADWLEFFNDWMLRSGNRANPELIRNFAKNSGDAFDWYTEVLEPGWENEVPLMFWPPAKYFKGSISGYKFWVGTPEFHSVRNPGYPTLTDCARANQKKAESVGARILWGTKAVQLITKSDDVTGVIAKNADGKYISVSAKTVILAAGDFSRNAEMCKDLLPDISGLFEGEESFRGSGRDGSGIQMGVWAGGRLEAGPIATMGGNYYAMIGITGTFGSLWVDNHGMRYCNEMFGDPVMAGFPGAERERGYYFNVFDSNILDHVQHSPPAHTAFRVNDPKVEQQTLDILKNAVLAGDEGFKDRGRIVYAADTWQQLGARMGFEGEELDNFIANVARYNELCRSRRDEDFGKDADLMNELNKPPFFAERSTFDKVGAMMVTCGGLLTDGDQRVLNEHRRPIKGLLATGNCCGRRFGTQYSTPAAGVSLGIAVTLGREAGKFAAKNI